MTNYQNSKIYKIESLKGNVVYYGSTTQKYLSARFRNHRYEFKTNKCGLSKQVLEYDDAKIILVELYPCNSKDELIKRESYYIRNNECVNKVIPDRTPKEWYNDNKPKITQTKRDWYIDNKSKILNKSKQYNINNKDKLHQKFNCKCGGKYTYQSISRHKKSKKHLKFID